VNILGSGSYSFQVHILFKHGKLIVLPQDYHATNTKSIGDDLHLGAPDIEHIAIRRECEAEVSEARSWEAHRDGTSWRLRGYSS